MYSIITQFAFMRSLQTTTFLVLTYLFVTNHALGQQDKYVFVWNYTNHTQSTIADKEFPETRYNDYENRGYKITDVIYDEDDWVLVVEKNKYKDQRYKRSSYWPVSWIDDQWENGFDITSICYGNGQWVVVMSKEYVDRVQALDKESDWATMKANLLRRWDNGYHVIDAAYANGEWVFCYAKNSGWTLQSYYYGLNFPADWINKKYNEDGKSVTTIAYGGGKWLVFVSDYSLKKKQIVLTHSYWPKNKFNEYWHGELEDRKDVFLIAYKTTQKEPEPEPEPVKPLDPSTPASQNAK